MANARLTRFLEKTGGAIQIFRHSFTAVVHQAKIVASFAFAATRLSICCSSGRVSASSQSTLPMK